MTDDQREWFGNGVMWCLVVLRDMGVEVNDGKFFAFLTALADGTLSRRATPAEIILEMERQGLSATLEHREELHHIDPIRRKVNAEADREAATVVLKMNGIID